MYGSGLFMLGITASGCNLTLIIVLYSLLLYVNGFKYSGYNVTHVDMCPPLAGILFGLTNGIASLTGIIAPNMVGAFTSSGGTRANWNKVFYVTAGIYFITSTIFNLLVSAELQDWNTKKATEKKPKTAEAKS
ncbi:UNVERIFIED_CONTAM: Picot [Trichonephila clavipes]